MGVYVKYCNRFFRRRRHQTTVEQECLMWGYRVIVPDKFRSFPEIRSFLSHGYVKIKRSKFLIFLAFNRWPYWRDLFVAHQVCNEEQFIFKSIIIFMGMVSSSSSSPGHVYVLIFYSHFLKEKLLKSQLQNGLNVFNAEY